MRRPRKMNQSKPQLLLKTEKVTVDTFSVSCCMILHGICVLIGYQCPCLAMSLSRLRLKHTAWHSAVLCISFLMNWMCDLLFLYLSMNPLTLHHQCDLIIPYTFSHRIVALTISWHSLHSFPDTWPTQPNAIQRICNSLESDSTSHDKNEARRLRSRIWGMVMHHIWWLIFGLIGAAMVGVPPPFFSNSHSFFLDHFSAMLCRVLSCYCLPSRYLVQLFHPYSCHASSPIRWVPHFHYGACCSQPYRTSSTTLTYKLSETPVHWQQLDS